MKILIAGGGIAGCMLAWHLHREGAEVVLYAEDDPRSASCRAGGLMHAYSGRDSSIKKAYLPFLSYAVENYRLIESALGERFLYGATLLHWGKDRATAPPPDPADIYFNDVARATAYSPVYKLDAAKLIAKLKFFFDGKGALFNKRVAPNEISVVGNHVCFDGIRADRIIFCEGALNPGNRYFSALPFIFNKGDYLLLEVPGLPEGFVFQNGVKLIYQSDGVWWCGAGCAWAPHDVSPDREWRIKTQNLLDAWLRTPYKIVSHEVGLRPTTAGQFPLMGFHPNTGSVGIFNGLGMRGLMMAPLLAKKFSRAIIAGSDRIDGYDNARFSGFFL